MATARSSTGDATAARERLRDAAPLADYPLTPLRAAAFWAAIALPAVYLSLLAVAPETPGAKTAFLALLALHTVAVVAGHDYRRD